MKSALESTKDAQAYSAQLESDDRTRGAALRELDSILSSRYFKSADRCKQFLRYVVLSKVDGHIDRLKERTIGTEVFQRPPGYATGEDPVVRVQAGEVRRRLHQYYQETPQSSALRIELPVGSYSPVFHWGPFSEGGESPGHPLAPHAASTSRWGSRLKAAALVAIGVLAALSVIAFYDSWHRAAASKTALEQFWSPAIASHQPILICIANASLNQSDVLSQPSGGDPSISSEIVPAADASVAAALSDLFGRLDKPNQLRIGAASTYEDLRNSPAALIGGFNSRWTMQLVSNLHFLFSKDHGQYTIHERIPGGRVWTTRLGPHGETVEDFAIVGRLIDSKTGQFAVTIAGIGPRGTQAAGEFVSSSRALSEGLAGAPADWANRNLEVLLETTVTDSVAGPPHVIAMYSW
jgi:hypothetical protein